jgi:hypothetical protein
LAFEALFLFDNRAKGFTRDIFADVIASPARGGFRRPLLTGLIVSRTHSFFLAFACAAIALLIGAGAYLFLVGEVAPLTWQQWDKSTAMID